MTLEELQKVKWTNLRPGIDYISTQETSKEALKKDSFAFKLIGLQEDGIIKAYTKEAVSSSPDILSTTLKEHLTRSKAGYLRVNLFEMLLADFKGQIYLRGDYMEPFSFSEDSTTLLSIPGIKSAKFISKDEAQKKYIDDGGQDWSEVLDENPLPNAIEIGLEDKNLTKESLEELETVITQKILMAVEFNYPALLIEETKKYYFFEYKRL